MSKITPQSFSRNAENQVAATLESKVSRFHKSKKNRLYQSFECLEWAQALHKLCLQHGEETVLPNPIPGLPSAKTRMESWSEGMARLKKEAEGNPVSTNISKESLDRALANQSVLSAHPCRLQADLLIGLRSHLETDSTSKFLEACTDRELRILLDSMELDSELRKQVDDELHRKD